jgi:hypothetical protein
MRVLNVVAAGSSWLFDIADLNPKGKSVFPEIIDWLKDTYNFKQTPETAADIEAGKGLIFRNGEFQAREEVFVDVQLTIFNDGLVAKSSSSTEDTDKFLENVVSSAVTEFSLAFDPGIVRRKIYLSELNIRLDTPLANLDPKLTAFADKLTSMCSNTSPVHFEVGGIAFWTDSTFAVTKTPAFLVERKHNAPFSENRFYTKAPLQTQQHIEMLAELEAILASS